jgi:hypothetical protein
VECNGVWVNFPCVSANIPAEDAGQGSSATRVLPEQSSSDINEAVDIGQSELNRKRNALHEFLTDYARLRQQSSVRISTAEATDNCLMRTVQFEECQAAISRAEERLQRLLEQERNAIALRDKELERAEERAPQNVIVVQPETHPRFVVIKPREQDGRRLGKRGERPRRGNRPVARSNPIEREQPSKSIEDKAIRGVSRAEVDTGS